MNRKCLRSKGLSTGRQKQKDDDKTVQTLNKKDFGVLDLSVEHDLSFDIFVGGGPRSCSSTGVNNEGTAHHDLSEYEGMECCPVCLRTVVSMARHLESCGPRNGVTSGRLSVLCKLHQVYLQKRKTMGFPVNFHEMEPFDSAKFKKLPHKKITKSGPRLKPPLFSSSQNEKDDIIQQKIVMILADSSDVECLEPVNNCFRDPVEFPLWFISGVQISSVSKYYVSDLSPFIDVPANTIEDDDHEQNEVPKCESSNASSDADYNSFIPEEIPTSDINDECRKRKLSIVEEYEFAAKKNKSTDLNLTEPFEGPSKMGIEKNEASVYDFAGSSSSPEGRDYQFPDYQFVESFSSPDDFVKRKKSPDSEVTVLSSPTGAREETDYQFANTLSSSEWVTKKSESSEVVEILSSPEREPGEPSLHDQLAESFSLNITSKNVSDFQFAKSLSSPKDAVGKIESLKYNLSACSPDKDETLLNFETTESVSPKYVGQNSPVDLHSSDTINPEFSENQNETLGIHFSNSFDPPSYGFAKSADEERKSDDFHSSDTLPLPDDVAKISDSVYQLSESLALPGASAEGSPDYKFSKFVLGADKEKVTSQGSPESSKKQTSFTQSIPESAVIELSDDEVDMFDSSPIRPKDTDYPMLKGSTPYDNWRKSPRKLKNLPQSGQLESSFWTSSVIEKNDLNFSAAKEDQNHCFEEIATESGSSHILQIDNIRSVSKAYEDMDDDELKEELSKFGLKRSLGRRKGIVLLNFIKEQLNKQKNNVPIQNNIGEISNSLNHNDQSVAELCESIILPDNEEYIRGGQLEMISEFIKSNRELHTSLLQFKPIWLDEFQKLLNSKNIKISKSKLKKYSDYLGIIYREKQKV